MTLDERAQKTCNAFLHRGYIQALIEAFRDQIEECAKVAEACDKSTHPAEVADKIRALATPPTIEEGMRLWEL